MAFYILRFHSCLSVSVVWHENWSHQIIDSSISTLEQDVLKIKIAGHLLSHNQPISASSHLFTVPPLISYHTIQKLTLHYSVHCTMYSTPPPQTLDRQLKQCDKDSYFVLVQSGLAFGGRGWVKMAQKADIQPRIYGYCLLVMVQPASRLLTKLKSYIWYSSQ